MHDAAGATRKATFTWDALGRRVEHINDTLGSTTRYYYDGVNEIVDDNQAGSRQRYYVHGLSYVDERLMMYRESSSRRYYYVTDRMYNVVAMIDRGGAIVERPALDGRLRQSRSRRTSFAACQGIAYNAYGQPLIREAAARGDLPLMGGRGRAAPDAKRLPPVKGMDNDADIDSTHVTLITDVKNGAAWDARGDMDDDGDVDSADTLLHANRKNNWYPSISPTVAQAFSDVGNPYMFQGVPYFVLDTAANTTVEVLPLNHHRARFSDPTTGRWNTRDPLRYQLQTETSRIASPSSTSFAPAMSKRYRGTQTIAVFEYLSSDPCIHYDATRPKACKGCTATQCSEVINAFNTACDCIAIAKTAAQSDPNADDCVKTTLACMASKCANHSVHPHCNKQCDCIGEYTLGQAWSWLCTVGIHHHYTVCERGFSKGLNGVIGTTVHEMAHCCGMYGNPPGDPPCSAEWIQKYVHQKCDPYKDPF